MDGRPKLLLDTKFTGISERTLYPTVISGKCRKVENKRSTNSTSQFEVTSRTGFNAYNRPLRQLEIPFNV